MYFLNTSALVKRYVTEVGSSWIKGLPPLDFIVGSIVYPEVYSALARHLREGSLAKTDYNHLIQMFNYDMERRFRIIDLTRGLYQKAGELAHKHALRGYDSVQLACALRANHLLINSNVSALTFLSADRNLLQAELNEGLTVDNPQNH